MSIDRQTHQAMQLQRQGKTEEASQAWQRILHSTPNHVPALANLASLQARTGHPKRAIKLFKRALKVNPRVPEIWFNLGNLMNQAGDRIEAERAYRRALKLNREFAPAWNNLGALLRDLKRNEEAAKCFSRALALSPGLVRAHCAYADIMLEQGKLEQALVHFTRAREANPAEPQAYLGLGNVLAANGQYADAITALKGGLALEPDSDRFLAPLAELFQQTGQEVHALSAWQSILQRNPGSAEAQFNTGRLQYRLGSGSKEMASAVDHLRRAAELKSDDVEYQCQLGFTLAELGQSSEAGRIAEQAVSRHGQSALAHMLMGYVAVQQARISEGLAAYKKAHELTPDDPSAIGNLCFSSLYADFMDASQVAELHRELAGQFSALFKPDQVLAPVESHERLRVGFLSPDFRSHPVGFFMEPLLANLDRESIEIFGYANASRLDATGQALAGNFDQFRMCAGLDDRTLLEMIRTDQLDVLVDLAGFTSNNRAAVIAARAAPVQAVYLGYPCTTGLPEMDYCIGDSMLMPEGSQSLYSEQLMPLDSPFLCFQPRPGTPEVTALPALENGFITFGSFNNYAKVSDLCVRTWSRILEAVPESRLLLKSGNLADSGICEFTRQRFEEQGVDPGRILTEGPTTPVEAFLAEYGKIDIALDTLPYNGGTTTCDALWMGVPVVSFAGRHFYQRMGASILGATGHSEWVADSEDDYVATAVRLSSDIDTLQGIRTQLREQVSKSPLCDSEALARAFEKALRAMKH